MTSCDDQVLTIFPFENCARPKHWAFPKRTILMKPVGTKAGNPDSWLQLGRWGDEDQPVLVRCRLEKAGQGKIGCQ